MATSLVHPARIRTLTADDVVPDPEGDHVLYWMQRSQRAERNDALEHAIRLANDEGVPLRVVFVLDGSYPEANRRHLRFMLQGLAETIPALRRRDLGADVLLGDPVEVVVDAASSARLVVTDRAYLRHLVDWRSSLAGRLGVPLVQVEGDVVVPADEVSDKREYAARTIRPKLHELIDEHVEELSTTPIDRGWEREPSGIDLDDIEAVLDELGAAALTEPGPDGRDDPHVELVGGTSQARAHLDAFLSDGLSGYGDRAPDPVHPGVSHLSPYLHFGQISPIAVVLAVRDGSPSNDDRGAYVEELVVRRELAVNYVVHEPRYDSLAALPDWARTTLDEHRDDEREHVYTASELERGETHDPAWNAAMAEMRETGYLHNHLRMYWAKQVLLWTNTPEHAFRTLLELNDRYFIDGRDCSSFANVA